MVAEESRTTRFCETLVKIVGKIFDASGMEIVDRRIRRYSNTAIEYVRIIASCREMVEQIAGLRRINFLMVSLEDTIAND